MSLSKFLKVLVIGSGAREHALVWKIAQSPRVEKIFVAPGNGGTATIAENLAIHPTDMESLAQIARDKTIDLVIVGPELPLSLGIVDYFNSIGILTFGPTKAAAQIESSKTFARDLMRQNGIPCPEGISFSSFSEAHSYLLKQPPPFVIKADGLASGKGIIITDSLPEARQALEDIMKGKILGPAGNKVIIDNYIIGKEVSLLAFTDGKTISTMVPACDYKKVWDGDRGPNTGGMGSFSPPKFFSKHLLDKANKTIFVPIVNAMAKKGITYKGVLYAGLMVTDDEELSVLEFNCRFGDPEAQVILPLLKTDLIDICMAVIQSRLDELIIEWSSNACVGIVMTSAGYPGNYEKGFPIAGLDKVDKDILIFHAGTKIINQGTISTDGGRVLTVACTGKDITEARAKVYYNLQKIDFKNCYYRKDIALREVG
jgi:phosphoribosylamine---glycine ligase